MESLAHQQHQEEDEFPEHEFPEHKVQVLMESLAHQQHQEEDEFPEHVQHPDAPRRGVRRLPSKSKRRSSPRRGHRDLQEESWAHRQHQDEGEFLDHDQHPSETQALQEESLAHQHQEFHDEWHPSAHPSERQKAGDRKPQ